MTTLPLAALYLVSMPQTVWISAVVGSLLTRSAAACGAMQGWQHRSLPMLLIQSFPCVIQRVEANSASLLLRTVAPHAGLTQLQQKTECLAVTVARLSLPM